MRTLILSRERTPAENILDIREYFYNDDGYARASIMSGLFAYEDRDPYLLSLKTGRRVFNHDLGVYVAGPTSEKLQIAINRWCDKGKGKAIIHGRNIPRISRATAERMPYKIDAHSYFYHLGAFGQTDLWNVVRTSRDARAQTNLCLYTAWKHRMASDSGQIGLREWNDMHKMDTDVESDEGRSWTSFIWNNGDILKYDSIHNENDSSTSLHFKPLDYKHNPVIEDEQSEAGRFNVSSAHHNIDADYEPTPKEDQPYNWTRGEF